ncbi:hypothetical protein OSTOST_10869 [Ostertagia ostertagi]
MLFLFSESGTLQHFRQRLNSGWDCVIKIINGYGQEATRLTPLKFGRLKSQEKKPAGFTNWAPGQPNYEAGHCAYMQVFSGSESAWYTDDCDNDHNYICQAKPCDSTNYCEAE